MFVACVAVTPLWFVLRIWRLARTTDWIWTSEDSRNMYVDATKTLITASGIAVALLASSVSSGKTVNSIVSVSAKVAVVCLIVCVVLSFVVNLALIRLHEEAKGRNIDKLRTAGTLTTPITEGKLNVGELLFILVPSGIALSCFLVGFVFLGRIVFHI